MFDFVRNNTKIMMGLLFLLIIPSFVLFGIEGYSKLQEQGATVARVDGHKITQLEWDAAHKNEIDRIRAENPNANTKLLDSPEARYFTLERLVRDRVLASAAAKMQLVTSDGRLARDLQQNPTIASLRRADGSLDMEAYRTLVGSQGMTPEMFENQVRADLSRRQVLRGVSGTGFATPAQAGLSMDAFFARREVQLAQFNTADFAAKAVVTDADLETYYKRNEAMFQAPELASIEYVVLDVASLLKNTTVSEDDLKTYYEQNQARLAGREERRASHILISAGEGVSGAERQKAKEKAVALRDAVRKAPETFAEVARKNSQDTVSAAQGGDLDFFGRGAMTKPFEEAAFALAKGEISDVVETEFGYHIIRVTDIRAPKVPSFAEVRGKLETELKQQQAQRQFAEVAETFSNAVYEQSDSLQPVAERLKLEIRTASQIARTPAPGATGVLANEKFLTAIFSPDSVEKRRNTPAVELASNQLVAGRITQYAPAHTRPLAEVRESVRARLVAERGAALARTEGEAKLAAWRANPAQAVWPAAIAVSRVQPAGVAQPVIEAALRADVTSLPALVGVDLGAQGYAIARVDKVLPREAEAADRARQEVLQYNQLWAAAESVAYYSQLKERFKAEILVAKPVAGIAPNQ